jgi:hypothetical protein
VRSRVDEGDRRLLSRGRASRSVACLSRSCVNSSSWPSQAPLHRSPPAMSRDSAESRLHEAEDKAAYRIRQAENNARYYSDRAGHAVERAEDRAAYGVHRAEDAVASGVHRAENAIRRGENELENAGKRVLAAGERAVDKVDRKVHEAAANYRAANDGHRTPYFHSQLAAFTHTRATWLCQ